jgi:hypothetical protein
MLRLFPTKFGLRKWLLSTLAVGMAIDSAYFTSQAGFGAAFLAMMLFTFCGTAVFIVISGKDRLFFTALFNFLFITFDFGAALFQHFWPVVGGETDLGELVTAWLFCYGSFVALPTVFVWAAPKILKYARRDP